MLWPTALGNCSNSGKQYIVDVSHTIWVKAQGSKVEKKEEPGGIFTVLSCINNSAFWNCGVSLSYCIKL